MIERKNIRLKNYDYSRCGYYFITICTYNHEKTLANIRRGDPCGRPNVEYSLLGKIAKNILLEIPNRYNVKLDYYVVMPNHIHMILFIEEQAITRVATTIGNIVGGYKSIVANKWLNVCKENMLPINKVWQRNYYEHVIRNEYDLYEIRKYIEENPIKWTLDKYYE